MKTIYFLSSIFLATVFTANAQNTLDMNVFKQAQLTFSDGTVTKANSWLTGKAENKVVFFWATWCGPCVMEMEALIEGVEAGKADPSHVYFISDESIAKVEAFIKKKGIQGLNIVLMSTKAPELGIRGIPFSVAFNDQGEIVATETGFRNKRHTLDFVAQYGK